MFDFKKFRKDRKWTQTEAARTIFGMTAPFWATLEQGNRSEQQLKAYAVACELWASGQITTHPKQLIEQMQAVREKYGIYYNEASELMGHGVNNWSNLITGNLEWSKRWVALVHAVLWMLDNPEQEQAEPVQEMVVIEQPKPASADSFEHVEHIMLDDEPFWIVADVCRAIEHSNSRQAVSVIDPEDVRKHYADSTRGDVWVTNEAGLYTLLLRSNLPKAKPFKRWVTSEVLPSIRKTGSYQARPQGTADPIDAMILSLQELKAVQAKQAQLEQQMAEMRRSTVTVQQVAQIAEAKTTEAHEQHRSDVYYIDKHVKTAARELTVKVHGSITADNGDVWRAHNASKIKEINSEIRAAVAKNYACHPKQAPGRDRYTRSDKRTAYDALNKWRALNGLQTQLAFDLGGAA